MSIEYQVQTAFPVVIGDVVTLDKIEWICLVACTVIGFTVERSLPVLGSPLMPYLNSVELAVKSQNPNVKPGQSLTEARSLMDYTQVGPHDIEEIEGKKILKWAYDSFDSFILMFEDGTYLKMELTTGESYEHSSLQMEKLTLGDLRDLGLLSPGVWDAHQVEKARTREAQNDTQGAHLLACAIDNLGIERVKEMVAKTTPEN